MNLPVKKKKHREGKPLDVAIAETEEAEEIEKQEEAPKKSHRSFNAKEMQADIGRLLDYSTFEPKVRYYLDTGSEELHAVFGGDKGIPYGKVIELSGEEHAGKTLVATVLAAMAQQDNAGVGRVDLEDSRDPLWEVRFGLDPDSVVTLYPKLIFPKAKKEGEEDKPEKKSRFGKKKKQNKSGIPRLQSVQEVLSEMEVGMLLLHQRGFKKQFWFIDSVANMQTEMQIEAGFANQNMRTRNDRAMFLSEAFPKIAGLAANYNACVFLLNQLREKPGVMFGDPLYSPGGRGLRHATSIRARIMRKKGLTKDDKAIGLVSLITNRKNKMGGGSTQNAECGFVVRWNRTPAKVEFVTSEEVDRYKKKK